ncbi:MAG: putative toxin-antitoxin system toxin component, PIN family [Nanoarchaeota archaeon]
MNVVLDTNVLISATLWKGSEAQKLIIKLSEPKFKLFTSKDILSEYERVLIRDFSHSDELARFKAEKLANIFTLVNPSRKIAAVTEDPTDNKIIECAVESSSDCIVTYDKHLLKLKKFEKIKIVTPKEMMRII